MSYVRVTSGRTQRGMIHNEAVRRENIQAQRRSKTIAAKATAAHVDEEKRAVLVT